MLVHFSSILQTLQTDQKIIINKKRQNTLFFVFKTPYFLISRIWLPFIFPKKIKPSRSRHVFVRLVIGILLARLSLWRHTVACKKMERNILFTWLSISIVSLFLMERNTFFIVKFHKGSIFSEIFWADWGGLGRFFHLLKLAIIY